MIKLYANVSSDADLVVPTIAIAVAFLMCPLLDTLAVVLEACRLALGFGRLVSRCRHGKTAGSNNGSCRKCRETGNKLIRYSSFGWCVGLMLRHAPPPFLINV